MNQRRYPFAERELRMEWKDEHILTLIKLIEKQPCIWNPKHGEHNSRMLVKGAWARINRFFGRRTVVELKNKWRSLVAQYKRCLEHIQKTIGTDESYSPTWFAFKAIDNFMGAVYRCQQARSTEGRRVAASLSRESSSVRSRNERSLSHMSAIPGGSGSVPISERRLNNERPFSHEPAIPSGSGYLPICEQRSNNERSFPHVSDIPSGSGYLPITEQRSNNERPFLHVSDIPSGSGSSPVPEQRSNNERPISHMLDIPSGSGSSPRPEQRGLQNSEKADERLRVELMYKIDHLIRDYTVAIKRRKI